MDLKLKRRARSEFVKLLEKYKLIFPSVLDDEAFKELGSKMNDSDKELLESIRLVIGRKSDSQVLTKVNDKMIEDIIVYGLNHGSFGYLLSHFRNLTEDSAKVEDFKRWMGKRGILESYEEAERDRRRVYTIDVNTLQVVKRYVSIRQACLDWKVDKILNTIQIDKGYYLSDSTTLITKYGMKLLEGYKY